MISIKSFMIACILLAAGTLTAVAGAADADKVLILQDENYFLQEENARLKASLADNDAALKKCYIEKEALPAASEQASGIREKLEARVISLERALLDQNAQLPKKIEDAVGPFRAEAAQKEARLVDLSRVNDVLESRIDTLTGEKISLRESLKKVADELEALKAAGRPKVLREVAKPVVRADTAASEGEKRWAAKVEDLNARLEDCRDRAEARSDELTSACREKLGTLKDALDTCRERAALKK